jgi:hypothetical protein
MDRVPQQPDRAGQDRQQQLDDAGRGQPDRADRDRTVGFPAFLHVISGARQGKRGGRVTHTCGFMHPASMARYPRHGKFQSIPGLLTTETGKVNGRWPPVGAVTVSPRACTRT